MQHSATMPTDQWDQLVLGENYKPDKDHKREYWENWVPAYHTLIVIDYLHLYRHAIDAIIRRCRTLHNEGNLQYLVRILLIDHVFPDHLTDVPIDERLGAIQ